MRSLSLLVLGALALPLASCDAGHPGAAVDALAPELSALANRAWGAAVNIDPLGSQGINTPALEGCPNESTDGRHLFFATNRAGQIDIWMATRKPDGSWGAPEPLPEAVNSAANDFCPTSLPGGGLLFVSARNDGQNCGSGTTDIYETRFRPESGWEEPVHLGCEVNSAANEFSPSYVAAGGGMLFFSSDVAGTHALYVSRRTDTGEWGAPAAVTELNLPGYNTARPNVSVDGLEIVFDSDRPGGLGFDIWTAYRANPHDAWSEPVNVGPAVNSAGNETRASISRNGRHLYFGSTRGGNPDLFMSTR